MYLFNSICGIIMDSINNIWWRGYIFQIVHKYFTAICSFKSKIYLQNKDTLINIVKPRSMFWDKSCYKCTCNIWHKLCHDLSVFLKTIVIDYHQLIFMYIRKVTLFFFIEKVHGYHCFYESTEFGELRNCVASVFDTGMKISIRILVLILTFL